jgi:hypothetical protein
MSIISVPAADVELGAVDYSSEIAEATLDLELDTLDKTNFESGGWEELTPGVKRGTLNLTFKHDTDLSGLVDALWTAFTSAAGTLAFAVLLDGGSAISATNPEFQGTILVSELSIGAAVNQLYEQSVSWPTTGAVVRDVTP